MSREAERQAALLAAILHGRALPAGLRGVLPAPPSGDEEVARQQGLQAYRGNAIALSERALSGAFPLLASLLGAQFGSLAWTFWRRCPPACGDLGEWGAALPDFLRQEAGDALAELAALEWALHRAERAADAVLDAPSLGLLHGDPRSLRLALRPGLCLLTMSDEALSLTAGH
ncbi:MAG TPA: DNA-binding domain-containing protein, partial [Burkholderiaceae bacterium]|nr:DNA-binding domain-containing protein [Burkholderiaceae bacterium]